MFIVPAALLYSSIKKTRKGSRIVNLNTSNLVFNVYTPFYIDVFNFLGYKNHTDCVVGQTEKRDRFATILVYLRDVAQGGETVFPQLGLSVKPKKGRALVWNSMNSDGECDPTSIHNAAPVIEGRKYILQRW